MTRRALRQSLRDARGFTIVELLVAAIIFAVVIFGMGSLYLSARQSFDFANVETFLQRQGTLIQEELARDILRAASLQVQTTSATLCRPSSSVTIAANQSILYERFVQNGSGGPLQTEFWCVYRHQPSGVPYPSLYRCPLDPTIVGVNPPPYNCTQTAENLLAGAYVPPGQALSVPDVSFSIPVLVPGAIATTVDLRFDLDLRRTSPDASLLLSPRRFSFNTTVRN